MSFSSEKLIEALQALPALHRAAFAASASERQFPNYEAFVAEEGCGDAVGLREGLDMVWTALATGTSDEVRARELMERMQRAAPDSSDFSGVFSSLAQDAAGSVYHALECCITGDPTSASFAGADAVESIDFYLMKVAGSLELEAEVITEPRTVGYAERWRDASPLMLAELLAQEADLTSLRASPTLTPELLRAMREKSQKAGIQPFERGLVKRENIPVKPRPVPPSE